MVAAAANARSDYSFQVLWPAAKPSLHFSYAFLYDPLGSSTPSCMKHADSLPLGVHEHNWKTVSGEDAEQNPRSRSNQAVSGQRALWDF